MKLKSIDDSRCIVMQQDILRCQKAFRRAEKFGEIGVILDNNRLVAYEFTSAYFDFILYLHAFLLAARERDIASGQRQKPGKKDNQADQADRDKYIMVEAQRILTRRRKAIQDGTAPWWENDIGYYPEKIPPNFAVEFRRLRNMAAHSLPKRATFDLREFIEKYHKFVYLLYWDCVSWWGLRGDDFPDLKEITKFPI